MFVILLVGLSGFLSACGKSSSSVTYSSRPDQAIKPGDNLTITWQLNLMQSPTAQVQRSEDNGLTWTTIETIANQGQYTYTALPTDVNKVDFPT